MALIDDKKVRLKTGEEITIRSARPEDAGAILAYVREVLCEPGYFIIEPKEFTLTEAEESAWLQTHVEKPTWLVLVAVAEGSIVGVLNFENGERKRAAHSGTLHLSLARAYREKGLGTVRPLLIGPKAIPSSSGSSFPCSTTTSGQKACTEKWALSRRACAGGRSRPDPASTSTRC